MKSESFKKNKSIAFVYYPYLPDRARLETMPFAFNILKKLVALGWQVDLFIWESSGDKYKCLFTNEINIRTIGSFKESQIHYLSTRHLLNPLRRARIFLDIKRLKDYSYVVSVGQIGASIGYRLAKSNGCPLIYLNDELPSAWADYIGGDWYNDEKKAANMCSLFVVPDEQRIKPLCNELMLTIDDVAGKIAIMPNAPLPHKQSGTINWHNRLGLPPDSIPFLHAGSIADWTQVPEIMCSVPFWPDNAVLVLHTREPLHNSIKQQLSHLFLKKKMVWSENPLSEDELMSLVSYCAASFALYRDLGKNISDIGWSSGKLLRSLVCGRPVIASDFESLAFIRENHLGYLVKHPSEIPGAVSNVINNRDELNRNSRFYSDNVLDFTKWWAKLCEKFESTTGLDLNSNLEVKASME